MLGQEYYRSFHLQSFWCIMDLIRDTPLGQFLRWITRNRILLYPEEKAGFEFPQFISATELGAPAPESTQQQSDLKSSHQELGSDPEIGQPEADRRNGSGTAITAGDPELGATGLLPRSSLEHTQERPEVGQEQKLARTPTPTPSNQVSVHKTGDGTILVDWYSTDDPDNPQNWSPGKKNWVLIIICLYSLVMYGGSSIYVPSEPGVMEHFGVSTAAASMGLSIFVVGYGVGTLLWAPLSEIPAIGRNGVYTPTFILFVILCVPAALVDNYAGLIVLRLLQGLLASPALANAPASFCDIFSIVMVPLYLSAWTAACFWGPSLGPVISSYAAMKKGWRWPLWELLWILAPVLLVFLITCPETSSANILRRRAQRLRKRFGRTDLRSQSEIDQSQMHFMTTFRLAVIKPLEITIKDPAIAYTNLYAALVYAIYYSTFQSCQLVYQGIYGFNLGELGLSFMCIGIGGFLGAIIFTVYYLKYLIPDIIKNGLRAPEHRLVPALYSVTVMPAGLFLFGWTARKSIHWIVSILGLVIMVICNFVTFQCIFVYLPLSYPQYAASVFAGNNLFRSLFAAGCVVFSVPMFKNLGIGGGISLLGGLSIVGAFGMFVLYFYGAKLRARSSFAAA